MKYNVYPKVIDFGSHLNPGDNLTDFGGLVEYDKGEVELIRVLTADLWNDAGEDQIVVEFRGLRPHLGGLHLIVGEDEYAPHDLTPEQQTERAAAQQLAILRYAVGACQNLPTHISVHYDDERNDPCSRNYQPYKSR